MIRIEPCPICGNSVTGIAFTGVWGKKAIFACEKCEFHAELSLVKNYEDAVSQYNKAIQNLKKDLIN